MASREDALAALDGRLRPLTAPLRRGARASGNPAQAVEAAHMNDKSHVSMEQHTCLVCAKTYDTGAILLDRTLRATLERHTMTGWGLCPEHEKFTQEGFIALVECDPDKSDTPDAQGNLKPWRVFRTGIVTFLKREAFLRLFEVPSPEQLPPCVFVEPAVTQLIKSRVAATAH
jgi:hypothetical protein